MDHNKVRPMKLALELRELLLNKIQRHLCDELLVHRHIGGCLRSRLEKYGLVSAIDNRHETQHLRRLKHQNSVHGISMSGWLEGYGLCHGWE